MAFIDQQDKKFLSLLLTPSWASGLIAVIVGLVLSLGVIGAYSLNNSAVQRQLNVWQQEQPQKELTKPGEIVTADPTPQLKDSWPLLIVWAGVGLIVYVIAAAMVHALSDAEALRESMGYVHADPAKTLEITIGHIILRLLAFAGLVAVVIAFYREVIPYCITAAHAAAGDLLSLEGLLYGILAFAVAALGVQIITIFLRMSLGRARVIGA